MSKYLRPDVYINRIANGVESVQSTGTSVAGMVGTSARGVVGKATIVVSWSDYVSKFAKGCVSPFLKASDLAYSVFGFFQNGGSTLVVTRVTDGTDKKATGTIATSIVAEALDSGEWANERLTVEVAQDDSKFDLIVKLDGELVESFKDVVADKEADNYIMEVVNGESAYITIKSVPLLVKGTAEFEGGLNGIADVTDAHYLKGLESFDLMDEISLIAIPGQTTKAVTQGVVDYCENRGDCFGVVDLPTGLSTEEVLAYRKELGGSFGATYYPWGKAVDPVGKGKLRLTPPSGHILGVYADTDNKRGVHKAPAGIEARIKGFVETERALSSGDLDLLNQAGVNCIVAKVNTGIVIWGAKLLTPNLDRKYVSDLRLDIDIEKSLYRATQWTMFESNDERLWNRLEAQVKGYLYTKWTDGALFGTTPEEAFFVKCDEELNTAEVRRSGRVLVEVGYAKQDVAEFTIFNLSQKTADK